jgi:hypothetical protein
MDLTLSEGVKHYYFIPIESCEVCINRNLQFLSQLKSKRLIVIFVGKNPNESWKEMIAQIRKNLNTLNDPDKKVYRYETGLSKPLLVSTEGGTCISSRTVDESEMVDVFYPLRLDD